MCVMHECGLHALGALGGEHASGMCVCVCLPVYVCVVCVRVSWVCLHVCEKLKRNKR